MAVEEQQTPYQTEVIKMLAEKAVRLPLPEMTKALLQLGPVGNLVFRYISAHLNQTDRSWNLEVSEDVEI